MSFGLFSGYFGDHKIIGSQTMRLSPTYPGYNNGGCFIAPPEATYALISGMANQRGPYAVDPNYWSPCGPACAYRVVFRLSPRLRYIPVIITDGTYDGVHIGSDGFISTNYDQNPIYDEYADSLPYLWLESGQTSNKGGTAKFIYRYTNVSTTQVTALGGVWVSTAGTKGADGEVQQLQHGGIIAGGAAAGGGGLDDGLGSYTIPANGGNVHAPWGIMMGGTWPAASGYPPSGGGACLYMHGKSYLPLSYNHYDVPGYELQYSYGQSGWVLCEFIAAEEL